MALRRKSTDASGSPNLISELDLSPKKLEIFAAKALRVFAYAFISIILPVYLLRLGYPVLLVGVISSLAIGSAAVYNLFISRYADSFGRRRLLVLLSLLMAASGIIFALDLGTYSLVLAALIGSISATGTETGPFMNIETVVLAGLSTDRNRTMTFSAYNFIGYAALSLGSLFSGMPAVLANSVGDMRMLFYVYAVIAIALALIYLRLGDSIEIRRKGRKLPKLGREAKSRILHMAALFSLDAFGGGFVIQTILALYFYKVWGLQLGSLSAIFFVSGAITAMSIFLAARIAKRIGLLNTMVLTHVPSSVFLMAIPFAPSALDAVVLLFLRQSISQMDVPTRQSYTMAIVKPHERTAAGSLTNTPRTIAQAISPSIASYMLQLSAVQLPFVIGGSLKIVYDVLVYFRFRKVKPPEES
jgi:predicted MFS family arabinose efflux permease